jgi:pyruvate/2-oxoglutarate dehydrogenase complex dihydrolipoamide acyltransferase (E2) component
MAAANEFDLRFDPQSESCSYNPRFKPFDQQPNFLTSCRGYRRAMAKSMAGANEVPHFTFCEEIDMDRLVDLRTRLQADATSSRGADVRFTYMPFIMKALSTALREFPEVNATVNSDATELTCRGGCV